MGDKEDLILLFEVPAIFQLKPWSARGASHHPAYMGNYYSHVFLALSKFSFKVMRMWVQAKISSCCLCVWCKSQELGGKGSTRFLTPIVESFFAVFVLFIESYWTELHLECCQISTTELLC